MRVPLPEALCGSQSSGLERRHAALDSFDPPSLADLVDHEGLLYLVRRRTSADSGTGTGPGRSSGYGAAAAACSRRSQAACPRTRRLRPLASAAPEACVRGRLPAAGLADDPEDLTAIPDRDRRRRRLERHAWTFLTGKCTSRSLTSKSGVFVEPTSCSRRSQPRSRAYRRRRAGQLTGARALEPRPCVSSIRAS